MNDCIVGTGLYTQYLSRYHSRRFDIWAIVHPEFQGRGIGGTLYNIIMEGLKAFNPTTLRTQAREYHPVIKAGNETGNRPMLTINRRLVFVRQPDWISFEKHCREE